MDNNRDICAVIADFVDSRFDYQYFPDSNVHSGTDAYVRTKDSGSVCRNDDFWKLDFK